MAEPAVDGAFLDVLSAWDGVGVVVRRDRPTGTLVLVAIHDDTLGKPVGGCRMKPYPSPADALRDATRLARGMTHKWASIGMPFGGGKAVLAVPGPLEGEARQGLLRRFGELLESLHGAYGTGEDLGTTPEDMHFLSSFTEHVMGADPRTGEAIDPGPYTALGVYHGIRAALEAATGSDDPDGRTVLVQGVGDVGAPLVRLLADAGARILASDVDTERAAGVAREVDGRVVDPAQVYGTPCDVYAPCAVGATLNARTVPLLACSVVAGSANNQLETSEDAALLHARGILYAPDYVVNAGGATAFGLLMTGVTDEDRLRARIADLGDALREIFAEAAERDESPRVAASRRVERVLAEARGGVSTDAAAGAGAGPPPG